MNDEDYCFHAVERMGSFLSDPGIYSFNHRDLLLSGRELLILHKYSLFCINSGLPIFFLPYQGGSSMWSSSPPDYLSNHPVTIF
jgi:hypothetical protein